MEDLQQYPETCYVKRRRRKKKSNQFHREHTYTPYPCARVGLVFGHNAMRRINPEQEIELKKRKEKKNYYSSTVQ